MDPKGKKSVRKELGKLHSNEMYANDFICKMFCLYILIIFML